MVGWRSAANEDDKYRQRRQRLPHSIRSKSFVVGCCVIAVSLWSTSTSRSIVANYDNNWPLYSQFAEDKLPEPVRILQQYQAWHSISALKQDDSNTHRRYAVGFYSCPLQAGNRLHHFVNSFIWAVITNRTLLWDYWDQENCQKYGQGHDPGVCQHANTEPECSAILERASWIPSLSEYSPLAAPARIPHVPFYATQLHTYKVGSWFHYRARRPFWESTGVAIDASWNPYYDLPLVAFPIMVDPLDDLLHSPNLLLHTHWSRNVAEALYSEGMDFLYGMLLNASFSFAPDFLNSAFRESTYNLTPSMFTAALHSRHDKTQDDGCQIGREQRCLDTVLQGNLPKESQHTQSAGKPPQHHPTCHVFLMSDRTCTLDHVTEYLKSKYPQCQVERANHRSVTKNNTNSSTSWLSEHGPFSGAGFYKDWILAARSRSAFIGTKRWSSQHAPIRSSSGLIRAWITYHKRMEEEFSTLNPLLLCSL